MAEKLGRDETQQRENDKLVDPITEEQSELLVVVVPTELLIPEEVGQVDEKVAARIIYSEENKPCVDQVRYQTPQVHHCNQGCKQVVRPENTQSMAANDCYHALHDSPESALSELFLVHFILDGIDEEALPTGPIQEHGYMVAFFLHHACHEVEKVRGQFLPKLY